MRSHELPGHQSHSQGHAGTDPLSRIAARGKIVGTVGTLSVDYSVGTARDGPSRLAGLKRAGSVSGQIGRFTEGLAHRPRSTGDARPPRRSDRGPGGSLG